MTTREEHMASPEFQERRQRDAELTRRIQDGFVPAEWDGEGSRPLVTDGELSEDASEALGELYQCYDGLIHGVSNEIYGKLGRPPGLNSQDIDQEGFYGLFRAALNWSPDTTRAGFLSYAKKTIFNHAMRKAREASTTVYVPHDARNRVQRYRAAFWQAYSLEEHLPLRERIAGWMDVSVEEVDEIAVDEALALQMGSIDRGYFDDDRDQHSTYGNGEGGWKPIDPYVPEIRAVEDDILIGAIQDVVRETFHNVPESGLDERELKILRLRFFGQKGIGEPMTYDEIGDVIGVTRERVRQIEAKTLSKLRHPQRRYKLESLLYEDVA